MHPIHNPLITSHHIQWPFLSSHPPWPSSCCLWSVDQHCLLWWDSIRLWWYYTILPFCLSDASLSRLFVLGFLLPSSDDLAYDLVLGSLCISLSTLPLSISYYGLYLPLPLLQWFLTLQPHRFLFWAAILNLQITTQHLSLDVSQRQYTKVDGYCHPFSQISFKPKFLLSSKLKLWHLPWCLFLFSSVQQIHKSFELSLCKISPNASSPKTDPHVLTSNSKWNRQRLVFGKVVLSPRIFLWSPDPHTTNSSLHVKHHPLLHPSLKMQNSWEEEYLVMK